MGIIGSGRSGFWMGGLAIWTLFYLFGYLAWQNNDIEHAAKREKNAKLAFNSIHSGCFPGISLFLAVVKTKAEILSGA